MKSNHQREVTKKTQLQTGYVKLAALVAVAAPLAAMLGAGRLV